MSLYRNIYDSTQPTRLTIGYDAYGNPIYQQSEGESFEEFAKRTGYQPQPSMSSQILSGVMGGILGYKMSQRKRQQSEREKEEELEQERKKLLQQAQAERLKTDRELIKKRALEQVRMETLRNYDYHEMMTHYFLGVDHMERPFDIDRYGVPYYLDLESLTYNYYSSSNMDEIVLEYSDAKRQRLGLPSLSVLPMQDWVYGETINNNPRNLQNVLKDEALIKAQLDEYKAVMIAKEQFLNDEKKDLEERERRQKEDDGYGY